MSVKDKVLVYIQRYECDYFVNMTEEQSALYPAEVRPKPGVIVTDQGSYAPWKTLKVLEFCLPPILTWKVLEFYDRSLKNREIPKRHAILASLDGLITHCRLDLFVESGAPRDSTAH